jgi:hypothetical protein
MQTEFATFVSRASARGPNFVFDLGRMATAAKLRPAMDIERRFPQRSAISAARAGHRRRTPRTAAAALLLRVKARRVGCQA